MIILTGAAGFIGSNVLAGLNAIGLRDILAVDRMRQSTAAKNLAGKDFVDYVDADDLLLYDMGFPKLDAVLHFGADSSTQNPNAREVIENNYAYSKRLLSLAAEHACPFIYASSASVYGAGEACIELPEYEAPQSPYAVSKWLLDQYVRRFIAAHPALTVIGLRLFNVYGPGEDHKGEMASVAYKSFQRLLDGKPPLVFEGSDDIKRDFIYVRDVVYVTLHMLTNAPSGIYNVGTGQAESFATLAKLTSTIADGAMPETVPFPAAYLANYQRYTQADITKLRSVGYSQPFTSLEDGLRAYWAHFAGRHHVPITTQAHQSRP